MCECVYFVLHLLQRILFKGSNFIPLTWELKPHPRHLYLFPPLCSLKQGPTIQPGQRPGTHHSDRTHENKVQGNENHLLCQSLIFPTMLNPLLLTLKYPVVQRLKGRRGRLGQMPQDPPRAAQMLRSSPHPPTRVVPGEGEGQGPHHNQFNDWLSPRQCRFLDSNTKKSFTVCIKCFFGSQGRKTI